ncbi:serine hydrolase domain-containing protein [uncultured Microbacterium sp.]|uniref:serine hydrolase domain-containing protein n=1 Tax=uncultured Microbacterium sp. TaxID=191216 RepID=UPI0028ECC5F3|nr:serine hydrolase domain-containing protein [uncultured Microbacterium sp.]
MTIEIHGSVEPGFEPVADAFSKNFTVYEDRGAACTVIIDGATVVDIYAGEMADGRPWAKDTRSAVFSVSKAVTAICLLMAAERGYLDLDVPVVEYWSAFGRHGKDRITTRQVLAHRTGTVAFEHPWEAADLAAWVPVVDSLAAQEPLWSPGSAFAYHPVSVGFIAGEILRRTTGMRPNQWLQEHIAGPLGLDVTFGAEEHDTNVAQVRDSTQPEDAGIPLSAADAAFMARAMLLDGAYRPNLFAGANGQAFLGQESPAANLVTSARDLARLFAATVQSTDVSRLLSDVTLEEALVPLSFGQPFFGPDKGDVWGTGFMLHSSRRAMAGAGSFGHDGAGGQLAFAHPGLRLGFGFQTVQPGGDDDPRAEELCVALRAAL